MKPISHNQEMEGVFCTQEARGILLAISFSS